MTELTAEAALAIPSHKPVVVYSNRPPDKIAGGAVLVIANLGVKTWVGPGRVLPDAEWMKLVMGEDYTVNTQLEDCLRLVLTKERPLPMDLPLPVKYNGKDINVLMFPVPRTLQNAHYRMISNGLIWPVMHSTDATALSNPKAMLNKSHKTTFHYPHKDVRGATRDPEQDFKLYKQFNELGNRAIEQARNAGYIEKSDKVWVHDYQCVNIKSEIYSHHTPIAPLQYLRQVNIGPRKTSLLQSKLFREYIKELAGHSMISFQRPVDVKNFLEIAATVDGESRRELINRQIIYPDTDESRPGQVTDEFIKAHLNIGNFFDVKLFGQESRIINIPVGKNQQNDLKAAQNSKINKTFIPVEAMDRVALHYEKSDVITTDKQLDVIPVGIIQKHLSRITKATTGHSVEERGKARIDMKILAKHKDIIVRHEGNDYYPVADLAALEIDYDTSATEITDAKKEITIKQRVVPLLKILGSTPDGETFRGGMLEPGLDPIDGKPKHRIIIAVHRADYTKSTLEKMLAAANYMAAHPEEKGRTHFLFFLEPTRSNVPGYGNYTKTVEDLARGLHSNTYGKLKWERNGWANSFTIIPHGINNEDFLGLMRHPNVAGMLAIARKDGHDLTAREAANVRADMLGTSGSGLGIVTTSGIGASDIISRNSGEDGAFVISLDDKDEKAEKHNGQTPFWSFVEKLKDTIGEVLRLSNREPQKLIDRYKYASEASLAYDINRFRNSILGNLPPEPARFPIR